MSLPNRRTFANRNVLTTPTALQLARLLRARAESAVRWADGAIIREADRSDHRWVNAWWSWQRLPRFREIECEARRLEGGCQ